MKTSSTRKTKPEASSEEATRSVPKPRRALSDAERSELRRREGIAAGAAKRSANTRPRTLDEVRATVHDAFVQVRKYAKKNRRPDFEVLAMILASVRGAMAMQPWERANLAKYLHGVEEEIYRTGWRPDGTADPREYGHPDMNVQITYDGLRQLQQAVADRAMAGLLPAEPPAALTPGSTIDFATAADRIRARRRTDRRDEP